MFANLFLTFIPLLLSAHMMANHWLTKLNFQKPHLFVIASDSMSPALKTGDLVLAWPENEYKVNQIVSYVSNRSDRAIVTHRIIKISDSDQAKMVQLQGDNNRVPDFEMIEANQILGKVIWKIPWVGYFDSWLQTPVGVVAGVVVPTTILVYEELKKAVSQVLDLITKRRVTGA